jgi:hypothetical protein
MLLDYIRIILRRWWLAVLPVLAVAAITAAGYQPPATAYQVTLRFASGLPPERTPGVYNYDRQYVWLASEYIANGLADIARTSLFAQNVADRLSAQGISIPAGQIQGALVSEQSQSIMVVHLTWPDAAQSAHIGEAIIAEITEHGASYWPQLSAANGTPAIALDQPAPVPIAVSLRDRFDLPARLLFGLAAGVALALLAHALDPFVRERREIERMGVSIVGEIPR